MMCWERLQITKRHYFIRLFDMFFFWYIVILRFENVDLLYNVFVSLT